MYRTVAFALVAAFIGAAGCATSGVSLSSSSYSGEDLATAQYDNLYDFFRAHSRVQVGNSGSNVPLAVRRTSGGSMDVSFDAPSGSGDRESGGGEGEPASGGYEGGANTARYAPAMLYIDDREVGSPIPRLRQIAPSQVESLELLRPSEASSQYGGDGRVAIIALTLKQADGS